MDCIFVTQDFLLLLQEKNREMDLEIHFKDTFRAFSKDEDGKQYKNTLKSIIVSRDFNGQKMIHFDMIFSRIPAESNV